MDNGGWLGRRRRPEPCLGPPLAPGPQKTSPDDKHQGRNQQPSCPAQAGRYKLRARVQVRSPDPNQAETQKQNEEYTFDGHLSPLGCRQDILIAKTNGVIIHSSGTSPNSTPTN